MLVSIPLIYYLFPFTEHLLNFFSSFALNSPIIFGLKFTILFSGTKQIGALLFSLEFWAASTLVANASTLVANEKVLKSLNFCYRYDNALWFHRSNWPQVRTFSTLWPRHRSIYPTRNVHVARWNLHFSYKCISRCRVM